MRLKDPYDFSLPNPKILDIKPWHVAEQESFPETIKATIEGLQANLGPDEELYIFYSNGLEAIRVLHVVMFKAGMAVVTGVDRDNNITRVIAHFKSLQFVCKVLRIEPTKEKTHIGFELK